MPSLSIFDCAVTGRAYEHENTDGKEAPLPPGWVEVTLRTRSPNPDRQAILQTMEMITNGTLSQWPPEARNDATQRMLLARQVSAQFAAALAAAPEFLEHVSTGYISLEEQEGEDAVRKIADIAGLSLEVLQDGERDDEGEEDNGAPEPAPEPATKPAPKA